MSEKRIFNEVFKMGKELGRIGGKINRELEPKGDVDELFSSWQDGIIQSADFVNNILPRIRQLAGCRDAYGVGTYTDCSDEQSELVNELIDKFWEGAGEGFEEGFKNYDKMKEEKSRQKLSKIM